MFMLKIHANKNVKTLIAPPPESKIVYTRTMENKGYLIHDSKLVGDKLEGEMDINGMTDTIFAPKKINNPFVTRKMIKNSKSNFKLHTMYSCNKVIADKKNIIR